MDRRQQLALTLAVCGALGSAHAQETTPATSPAEQPSPSMISPAPAQASSPAAPGPKPFRSERPRPSFNGPPPTGPGPRPGGGDPKTERKLEKMEERRNAELQQMDRPNVMDRLRDRRDLELNGPADLKEPKGLKEMLKGPKDQRDQRGMKGDPGAGGPPGASVQDMFDGLPPGEAREMFQRNLERWRELPPEERQALRNQQGQRGAQIQEEIDNVMRDNALKLDNDQREVFKLRYTQERRKLERQLRDQMASERAKRLPQIVEQLKREFNRPMPPPPGKNPAPPRPPMNQSAPQPPPPVASPAPTAQ